MSFMYSSQSSSPLPLNSGSSSVLPPFNLSSASSNEVVIPGGSSWRKYTSVYSCSTGTWSIPTEDSDSGVDWLDYDTSMYMNGSPYSVPEGWSIDHLLYAGNPTLSITLPLLDPGPISGAVAKFVCHTSQVSGSVPACTLTIDCP